MRFSYEDFAWFGSKTRRRELRRDVRRVLGTSSDPAPNIHQALTAAQYLDSIIKEACAGTYALQVVRIENGEVMSPSQARGRLKARLEEKNAA